MEYPSKKQKISRVDLRYRRSSPLPRESKFLEEPGTRPLQHVSEQDPLLSPEMKEREAIGHRHHALHHRQPTGEATVIVEVVHTVDGKGDQIGVQTLPSVPSVPAFPSDLTVPAVPQATSVVFPTVPPYPFTSGVNEGSVPGVVSSSQTPSSQTALSVSSTISATESVTESSLLPTVFSSTFAQNSTSSSTSTSSSSSSSSALNSTSSSSSSSTISSSLTSSALSSSSSPAASYSSPSTSEGGGGGGGGFGGGIGASSTANSSPTSSASSGSSGGNNDTIATPKIVGSVLGSLGGVALLLVIALLILKRYKRKRQGALQLQDNDTIASSAQQPPMTQTRATAGSSLVPSSAAGLFSRLSSSSKGTSTLAPTSPNPERGFQRISGRKLPSVFSEGMTSEQFERDRASGTMSGSSWYRDSQGTYGGTGLGPAAVAKETMMPSPARTPIIHHPGDEKPSDPFGGGAHEKETGGSPSAGGGGAFQKETMTPPRSPLAGPAAGAPSLSPPGTPRSHAHVPRGTLGRSHPSQDGSRGSRFTEEV